MEGQNVRAFRISYLRSITKYRSEGGPIVYMAETTSMALTQCHSVGGAFPPVACLLIFLKGNDLLLYTLAVTKVSFLTLH
jgi:hypothetical protein